MNIEKLLKHNKNRVTQERIDIFEYMETKHIFDANDLLSQFITVGRASIFRTINLFLDLWAIRRVNIWEKRETYELVEEDHHHEHMKCNNCGDVISFHSEDICKRILLEAEKLWFIVKEHSIGIFGKCKKCL
jgi:Fur family ferric uptake transcriptional regulator